MKIFETLTIIGLVVFLIFALCFAVTQVGAMAKRGEKQGWMQSSSDRSQ